MAIELLQAKLASDPKSKARSTRYPWVSRSGKRVEAALIQLKTNDEKAVSEIEIRRTDGKTSKVRINQLDLVSQQIAHVVAKVRSGKTDNQAPTNKPENANTNP